MGRRITSKPVCMGLFRRSMLMENELSYSNIEPALATVRSAGLQPALDERQRCKPALRV